MSEKEHKEFYKLDDILANVAPLIEQVAEFPSNPWTSNEAFIKKLDGAHELIDAIKEGAEVVIIAVNPKSKDKTTVFLANMEPEEALERTNIAQAKFIKAIMAANIRRLKDEG